MFYLNVLTYELIQQLPVWADHNNSRPALDAQLMPHGSIAIVDHSMLNAISPYGILNICWVFLIWEFCWMNSDDNHSIFDWVFLL